jgi:hypothetical protein
MKAATMVSREGWVFMPERLPAATNAGHRKSGIESTVAASLLTGE